MNLFTKITSILGAISTICQFLTTVPKLVYKFGKFVADKWKAKRSCEMNKPNEAPEVTLEENHEDDSDESSEEAPEGHIIELLLCGVLSHPAFAKHISCASTAPLYAGQIFFCELSCSAPFDSS